MARPPDEWPIPAYVVELRERIVVSYRVPARLLHGRTAAPLQPELVGGRAVVALCLSNGRCLKPVGGPAMLAREFRMAEVITPVRWQRACRPPLRGNCLLRLLTDSPSLRRFMGAALHYAADMAALEQVTERGRSYWSVTGGPAGRTETLTLTRDGQDEAWDSASLFSDQEEAEAGLLRPECYFIPDRNGECVRAAPLHQYARSTTRVRPEVLPTGLLAATLGAHPDDLILDHALLQKRCTHTWSFPPERIALARPVPTLLSNAGTRRVSLLAA